MREPGLFGREFRALRLGRLVAWAMVAALAASVVVQLVSGKPWQPAQDVLFVLAGAFLIQALAVVHALREAQVLGALPVVLAYLAVALLPMALVGVGIADTWVGFRERFARPTQSSK
jgi:sulfite exporter TauE/SafE